MSKSALIVWGGWPGHYPEEIARIFARVLSEEGFAVDVAESLDSLTDVGKLKKLSLLVPMWTMGKITPEQLNPLCEAVRDGVGIAGIHGGMCDSFREATE